MIDKVFTITVDNASSNDLAISDLKNIIFDCNSHPLKGEHLHVRCCAHILNLVVGDGLKLKAMHSSISKIRSVARYVMSHLVVGIALRYVLKKLGYKTNLQCSMIVPLGGTSPTLYLKVD